MRLSRWRPMSCSADVAQVSQLSALPAPSLYEKEHNMKNNSEKFFFFRVCVSSRRDFFGSAVKTLWNNIEWRAKSLMEFQRHLPWRAIGESLWKWDVDWTWLVSRSHLSRLWNVYAYANQIWTSLSCVYIACEHCQSVQLSSLNWDFTPFQAATCEPLTNCNNSFSLCSQLGSPLMKTVRRWLWLCVMPAALSVDELCKKWKIFQAPISFLQWARAANNNKCDEFSISFRSALFSSLHSLQGRFSKKII